MTTRVFRMLLALTVLISCESVGGTFFDTGISDDQSGSADGRKKYTRGLAAAGKNSSLTRDGAAASPTRQKKEIDTTAGQDYLTQKEREVIDEINRVRADPAMYARTYLVPMRVFYHGNLLKFPGEIAISTHEGSQALEECIRDLEQAKPLPPLSPQKGLLRAARDHAEDQARTGATGHTGSDGSSVSARLNRYGKWTASAGENIGYGPNDAGRIVASLLIDDGVSSRGHRKNLLDSRFNFVGVGVGPHPVYETMCVMDFAGGYKSN